MLDNIISIFESKSVSDIRFVLDVYIPQLSEEEIKILATRLGELNWMNGTESSYGKIIDPPYIFNQKVIKIMSDTEYRFYVTQKLWDELNKYYYVG